MVDPSFNPGRNRANFMNDPAPLRADHLVNAHRDTCGFETEVQLSPGLWRKHAGIVTSSTVCGQRKHLTPGGYYFCPIHDVPPLTPTEGTETL